MIMAVIILFVILGIGIALLATSDSQQRSASNQQGGESAYALAEAALNAQILELSLKWPTQQDSPSPSSSGTNYGYPSSCNAASNGYSYCPTASDLSTAYPVSSGTCPAGTQGDGWSSSSSVTNGWTTYVRDAGTSGSSTSSLFSSSAEQSAAPYDLTGSANPAAGGFVWVRAVGIVNCHAAVVITKVADQIIGLNFPKYVLNANSFTISDSGQKDVLNTQDTSGNTSQISLRCVGDGGLPPNSTCASVQNSNQIAPTTNYSTSPAPTPTLSASQLAAAKALAIEENTYIPASTPCSSINASQLQGQVVYIEGNSSCYGNGGIQIQSNSTFNAPPLSPGLLIIVNGSISFAGNSTFYGVIYAVDQANYSGTVVNLGGTTTVIGGVAVDGSGQVALNLGSSGNGTVACTDTGSSNKCGDLEFNAAAFNGLVGFAGAAPVPNTFRQLPAGQ